MIEKDDIDDLEKDEFEYLFIVAKINKSTKDLKNNYSKINVIELEKFKDLK